MSYALQVDLKKIGSKEASKNAFLVFNDLASDTLQQGEVADVAVEISRSTNYVCMVIHQKSRIFSKSKLTRSE